MTGTLDMRILELLMARLCHELIGPVAAVANGAELLAEDDADLGCDALALVGESARRAGNRLQFYRFAYGFGGDGSVTGPLPYELAARYFEATRIACDFGKDIRELSLDQQKLGCNLMLVGAEALRRGGCLALDAGPTGPELEVTGEGAGLSREAQAALMLEIPVEALTARSVQAYFAGLLARELGRRLVGTAMEPGKFRLISAAL
jgi:histidine phosphotransferase ChpT